ncbi:MAG: beta-ketoacyl-[acyl-carrier-protein] synthase family protein [Chloroflexi bacterium]|nr:beta-ketoacyl-[acyl-carrier-protein] synthase family protein [Chloroflexota bacterium]MBA3741167.1 beta-ketoacyl-[acyl-carrier-protein] synthase family protein [Chloroflexota bacterium]
MSGRRVVITGIGAITPVGTGAEALWQGVLADRSAVRLIDRFDASAFPSRIAAQINDFDPAAHLDPRRARRLDRFSALSVVAARMAVEHAGIALGEGAADRAGVWLGSALGGVAYGEEQHTAYVQRGARGVSPTLALAVFGGAGASNVALDLGLTGPSVGNANSCASGAMAIGQAFHAIRDGIVEVALAGGAEAPLAPLTFGAFALIRVLSTRNDDPATASRPFDRERDGFVMGEAAAMLVLEERVAAVRRGATIVAEMLGFGSSNDAYHMTVPRPDGREAARAIRSALNDAGIGPERIGYVNAHASSTPLNEPAEAHAIRTGLGVVADRVAVSGTKGLYGHALGASGAVEAAITALALQRGILPGTCNLEDLDPSIDLEILRDARTEQVDAALTNSFGFGGMNAALVLGRA